MRRRVFPTATEEAVVAAKPARAKTPLTNVLVKVPNSRDFERALKRFKREYLRSGVSHEYRRHEYYEKPSATKRRKHRRALKREAERQEFEQLGNP